MFITARRRRAAFSPCIIMLCALETMVWISACTSLGGMSGVATGSPPDEADGRLLFERMNSGLATMESEAVPTSHVDAIDEAATRCKLGAEQGDPSQRLPPDDGAARDAARKQQLQSTTSGATNTGCSGAQIGLQQQQQRRLLAGQGHGTGDHDNDNGDAQNNNNHRDGDLAAATTTSTTTISASSLLRVLASPLFSNTLLFGGQKSPTATATATTTSNSTTTGNTTDAHATMSLSLELAATATVLVTGLLGGVMVLGGGLAASLVGPRSLSFSGGGAAGRARTAVSTVCVLLGIANLGIATATVSLLRTT